MTLIPTYPDLPMEDVYPRVERTDTRELYLRDLGRNRVVYIPWDIDRTYWDVMCVDHGRLLRNAVAWATNEPAPVEVEGPGILDVDGVAAADVDDRPPRQPDQSDDDEGTDPRDLSGWTAGGQGQGAGGRTGRARAAAHRGHRSTPAAVGGRGDGDGAVGRGARSRRG